MTTNTISIGDRAYVAPLAVEWYGFAHRIVTTRYSQHCTACGAVILPGSRAHTWAMPVTVDAYPCYSDGDWRAHEATTEYRGSLTRCYECYHCYVAARTYKEGS